MAASLSPVSLISAPLLAALNHVLGQADWAKQKLQPFAGRNVRIAMPPFSLSFTIANDGCVAGSSAVPDLDVVLPAEAPLLALRGNEQVMKTVQINGPADLADALSHVLRNLRWDIEEDLSKVFGDIAAHRMVAGLKAFTDWQRQAARKLTENAGEYLVEESAVLVKAADFYAFADDIKKLRREIADIEARLNRT